MRIIKWACKRDFDFGELNEEWTAGTVNVNSKFWSDYLIARMCFEALHEQLVLKLPEKVREKTRQFDYQLRPILCPKCATLFKRKDE